MARPSCAPVRPRRQRPRRAPALRRVRSAAPTQPLELLRIISGGLLGGWVGLLIEALRPARAERRPRHPS